MSIKKKLRLAFCRSDECVSLLVKQKYLCDAFFPFFMDVFRFQWTLLNTLSNYHLEQKMYGRWRKKGKNYQKP